MSNIILKRFTWPVLILMSGCIQAEDIDLFVGATPEATEIPNLLIVLDNAANFSASAANCLYHDGTAPSLNGTAGGIEQCAFYDVVDGLAVNTDGSAKINIGMMAYNATNIRDINGANCGGTNGGCLMVPLMPMTAANKTFMKNWIKSWRTSGGAGAGYVKSNGEATAAAMQESWAYYAGRTGLSGRNYSGVKPASGCHNNYVLFVGNAFNNSGTPGDTGSASPATALANAPGSTDYQTVLTPTNTNQCGTATLVATAHENKGYYADEWARYMYGVDFDSSNDTLNKNEVISTYAIGLLGAACKPEYPALLGSMATQGHGLYFATNDYAELKLALETVLDQIQSVNSVFASVSLPVSVNTQGTYLNQVFVGMFRPEANSRPRWDGNLKQYKLGLVDGVLKLFDADDDQAINKETGFVNACQRSFWTPNSTDTYWLYKPQGGCSETSQSDISNYPDGNIVEKGAQAYQLRSSTTRTVKTCSPTFASCTSLVDFNTSNTAVTSSLLGTANDTEKNALINWSRGLNVGSDAATDYAPELYKATTVMRPSVHGDAVHSRPVAINYGAEGAAAQVVVFYGANDGMLRAINGNRDDSIGSIPAGGEFWSFLPPEFWTKQPTETLSNLKRIRDNSPNVHYFNNSSTATAPSTKPYGMDGSVTAHKNASHAWIYATMRRGGRAIYSFDVTDPANPSLKWKKGCPNNFPVSGSVSDTNCTTGWDGIGQTWSSPKDLLVNGYGSGTAPLLIMGGGYDTCEDYDALTSGGANHQCTSSTKGNAIYVLDADTGALQKTLPTDRAVVGDIFVVNDSATGKAKFAYAVDLGGNIYRISGSAYSEFGATAVDNWTITKIAALGCDTATCASGGPNRKFMFAPDVVQDPIVSDTYLLYLGSGDREKPLSGYSSSGAVINRFFMVKDQPTNASWLSDEHSTCGSNILCTNSLVPITSAADPSDATLAGKKGWYLALESTEQVVTSAITVFGVVTFSTHKPAVHVAGACTSNLGDARVYNVNYANAATANGTNFRYEDIAGDGLPPSPVAGVVTLDDGTTMPFVIGSTPDSPIESASPSASGGGTQSKGLVYWYLQR